MVRNGNRVGVGCYVDPITPLWSVHANIRLARVLGADDIWFGDHAKSMFPSSAWGPHLSPFARWIPSLDAFLDPTVTIAKYAGRRGPRMGTSVTDATEGTVMGISLGGAPPWPVRSRIRNPSGSNFSPARVDWRMW